MRSSLTPVVALVLSLGSLGSGAAQAQGLSPAPAEFEVPAQRISLFFGGGSAYLFPEERARLAAFLDALPAVGAYTFEIQGHTDDIGDRAYNLRLSAARAQTVRERLLAFPIPAAAIELLPLGEEAPSYDNGTWEGKLSNRRVDVILRPLL